MRQVGFVCWLDGRCWLHANSLQPTWLVGWMFGRLACLRVGRRNQHCQQNTQQI